MRHQDSFPVPGPRRFGSTAWSLIRHAQTLRPTQRARSLGQLLALYWRPVYWTLRTEWNASPEDARDLTQEYFAMFLEKRLLAGVAHEKGRFRAWVKATLRNFMLMRKRARKAQKRGGHLRIRPLDDLDRVESEAALDKRTPERRFDQELMRSIFQEALKKLGAESARKGKKQHFELFKAFYVDGGAEESDYGALQARFGLGPNDVKHRLNAMRKRLRELILSHLRDGPSTEEQLLAEVREIFEG
ncbi:MAG: ECF subfamily RNA polymerase sigma-24 [Planctomycetota bacterium]|nr:MAG: ECF subfamily RNA polymerase sigma-24 [Planctomycetota bacterium]